MATRYSQMEKAIFRNLTERLCSRNPSIRDSSCRKNLEHSVVWTRWAAHTPKIGRTRQRDLIYSHTQLTYGYCHCPLRFALASVNSSFLFSRVGIVYIWPNDKDTRTRDNSRRDIMNTSTDLYSVWWIWNISNNGRIQWIYVGNKFIRIHRRHRWQATARMQDICALNYYPYLTVSGFWGWCGISGAAPNKLIKFFPARTFWRWCDERRDIYVQIVLLAEVDSNATTRNKLLVSSRCEYSFISLLLLQIYDLAWAEHISFFLCFDDVNFFFSSVFACGMRQSNTSWRNRHKVNKGTSQTVWSSILSLHLFV